ncbi:uncharacterized protein TNCV_3328121 [Trichonephila clavipes]|nr:uncharacterized protein TNCV_3328121 [Trichonephila clavipes]
MNHGQVTWTTSDLAPPLLTATPLGHVSALNRFNMHRCPTRRVFCGTGLEHVTRQATVRYLYHSATAATIKQRAIGDGPRNFEPRLSDEDDTLASTTSPSYPTTSLVVIFWSPNLEIKSEISCQIWKWEIVNSDDPDQDNGTKLLNYCIVIAVLDRVNPTNAVLRLGLETRWANRIGLGYVRTAMASQCESFAWYLCAADSKNNPSPQVSRYMS